MFVDLQDHIVELYSVIAINGHSVWIREHTMRCEAVTGDKSRFIYFCGLDRKLFVELAFIASIEKAIGLLRSC